MLDLLICQEQQLSELNFTPGREANYADDKLTKTRSATELMTKVSTDVASCEARPFIYGGQPLASEVKQAGSVLHMLFAFEQQKSAFEDIQLESTDYEAPLPQCALIRGALKRELLKYKNLVPLEAFKDYMQELKKQMTAAESENLDNYLRQLLPNPVATHLSIERFYAIASALESIAYRQGPNAGDNSRKIFHEIIRKYSDK